MANVFDVANYILEQVDTVTAMKLQKLAYYSQAWALAWTDRPLFEENFQAWANGPVCPSLFGKHRGSFVLHTGTLAHYGSSDNLSSDEKSIIDSVLLFYGDKDPQWLSELTHAERPWKETRLGVAPGDSCSRVIPKELMQEYYAGL